MRKVSIIFEYGYIKFPVLLIPIVPLPLGIADHFITTYVR